MTTLRNAADDAHHVVAPIRQELDEEAQEKNRLESYLRAAVEGVRGPVANDDPSVAALRARIAKRSEKLEKLRARYDGAGAVWQARAGIYSECADYLKHVARVRSAPLVAIEPRRAPKPKAGETPADQVARLRARLDELRLNLRLVDAAPLPLAIVKTMAREKIERLAERGRPNVTTAAEGRREFEFASISIESFGSFGRIGQRVFDAEATFAWLHRAELLAAIDREIDACGVDDGALDDEARAAAREKILADMLECERDEEAVISEAGASGVRIDRRRDADPRAVLNLRADMPAPGE